MADETDVENSLVDVIAADLYPAGGGTPPYPTKIYAGWPIAAILEADIKSGTVHVSVYAVPGVVGDPGQIMDTAPGVVSPAVHGLTVTGDVKTITFAGTPTAGEYATAVIAGKGYTYKASAGETAADVAEGLAAEIATDYPGAVAIGNAIHLDPGPDIIVRTGAPVTMGVRIHRQSQQVRVVTWAGTPEARTAIARRVDLAIKRVNVIELADTTQAVISVTGAGPNDAFQLEGIYRRDLILSAIYDTLDTFTAYEVTHVDITTAPVPLSHVP